MNFDNTGAANARWWYNLPADAVARRPWSKAGVAHGRRRYQEAGAVVCRPVSRRQEASKQQPHAARSHHKPHRC